MVQGPKIEIEYEKICEELVDVLKMNIDNREKMQYMSKEYFTVELKFLLSQIAQLKAENKEFKQFINDRKNDWK